jgi:hypothetical protein
MKEDHIDPGGLVIISADKRRWPLGYAGERDGEERMHSRDV